MDEQKAELSLDTYKAVRKRFIDAGNSIFGPGFLNMTEYYYMKKNGHSPFAMLFSEPRKVYDEWVLIFKSEEAVRQLVEKAVGSDYLSILEDIKRNDGLRVWNKFYKISESALAT